MSINRRRPSKKIIESATPDRLSLIHWELDEGSLSPNSVAEVYSEYTYIYRPAGVIGTAGMSIAL
jgi:hypothetical protein